MKLPVYTLVTLALLCHLVMGAKKNKKGKQLAQAPQWKSGSHAGRDERFHSEQEGKMVKLDCRAKGKPQPKVSWFKDGQKLGKEHVRVEINKFKLTIKSLGMEDKGNYTCIVRNDEGRVEWTFYVETIMKIWPLVIEGPQNITALAGETVRFRCRVLNDAGATIRWVKGSSFLTSSGLVSSSYNLGKPEFLDNSDNPEVLTLKDIKSQDAGEYRCQAENKWGLENKSAYLTVQSPMTTTTVPTTKRTTTSTTVATTTTTTTTTTTIRMPIVPFIPRVPPTEIFTYGPDLYETTRAPKNRNNRLKNSEQRGKGSKNKPVTPAPEPPSTPIPTPDPFTTIWNLDGPQDNEYNPSVEESEVDDYEYKDTGMQGQVREGPGWVSLWTIYTIVGAISGVILLIGLLAITIAVCCRRDGGPVYKSTPV